MSPDKLVLSSFRKALRRLEDILCRSEVDDIIRDATIQRFEYTYEIAWKMIRRHLTWMGVSEVEQMSRRELFREAAQAGLIGDVEAWFGYHLARNKTSHTYGEEAAAEVFEVARAFAPSARRLLDHLTKIHG